MKKFLLILISAFFAISTVSANTVFFYFQDGEEDDYEIMYPSRLVSIWNTTAEELVEVPLNEAFMSYSFTEATMLRISPEDFDYEITVSVMGDLDTYMLDKEDNGWFLTLLPDADDLEITVKVYLAGQAPGEGDKISEVSMAFNVTAATGSEIANLGECVEISYFDRVSFADKTVEIAENYGSATVVPGTTFTIKPAEGYDVTDITSYSVGVASISNDGNEGGEWYVAVEESPATDFGSYFITVAKLASSDQPGVEPGEPEDEATITQIEDLQWKVEWPGCAFITQIDTDYADLHALLTDASGKVTYLVPNLYDNENPSIFFPEYGNFFTVNLTGLNLAAGTYELTIPEGYVRLGAEGTPNTSLYFDLVVGATPDVEYTVQFTDVMDNSFYITWENVTSLSEGNTTGAYIRNVETNEEYPMLYLEDDLYSKANLRIDHDYMLCVNLTNNYPNLPAGLYELYIPADYVKFNGTDKGNEAIDAHMFTYSPRWTEGNVELNGPTDSGIITLTWTDATKVEYNKDYQGDGYGFGIQGVTIFDDLNYQINLEYPLDYTIEGTTLTIDLTRLFMAEGTCVVIVPEDCLIITRDDVTDYTAGVSFTFQYGNSVPVGPDVPQYEGPATWSVKSGDTVYNDSYVEVGWGDYELTLIEDAEAVNVYSRIFGAFDFNYGEDVTLSADKKRLRINLGSLEESGLYRVNVPEACVYINVDGKTYFNTATSMDDVDYVATSGVSVVKAADGLYRVVNLQGVTVLESADAADLNSLPKGVYIVNGKKVVR